MTEKERPYRRLADMQCPHWVAGVGVRSVFKDDVGEGCPYCQIEQLRRELGQALTEVGRCASIIERAAVLLDTSWPNDARDVLQEGFPDETSERTAALQDHAYCEGAQQALAIAAQSWPAAKEWLREGCGNRRGMSQEVLHAVETTAHHSTSCLKFGTTASSIRNACTCGAEKAGESQ